jgi:aspartate kinase
MNIAGRETVVLKFGGTSVADATCIKRISNIAIKERQHSNVVIVVSAMGKTTDGLMKLAGELSPRPAGRELDMLLSTGEQVSISLVAMYLNSQGYAATSLVGWQAGFITECSHNRARIAKIKTDRLEEHLAKGEIVVVAGFQGISEDGAELTTLGRGGSDTSAVALASALKANKCDIYTDVTGVYTTDPRICKDARKLDYVSYEEMIELASLGAKVLHPRSVELAKKYQVKLSVRSSFEQYNPGTKVTTLEEVRKMELTKAVTGVAVDNNQAKIGFLGVPDRPGVSSTLFGRLAKENISVDVILQSIPRDSDKIDIAFTVTKDSLDRALVICAELAKEIEAEKVISDSNIAKVSIVGAGMLDKPGIAAGMFDALSSANINIQMITTSEIKLSCVIDEKQGNEAVKILHNKFDLKSSNEKIIV